MRVFSVPVSVPFLRTVIAALVDGRLVDGFEARTQPGRLGASHASICRPGAPDGWRGKSFSTSCRPTPRCCRASSRLATSTKTNWRSPKRPSNMAARRRWTFAPKLGELDRRLTLAQLVAAWAKSPVSAPLVVGGPASTLALAGDLARLMDDMVTRGVDWNALDGLVPDQLDQYWQHSLEFLQIARQAWPAHLAEIGKIEPAARRDLSDRGGSRAPDRASRRSGDRGGLDRLDAGDREIPACRCRPAARRGGAAGARYRSRRRGLAIDRRRPGRTRASSPTSPASNHPQFAMHALLRAVSASSAAMSKSSARRRRTDATCWPPKRCGPPTRQRNGIGGWPSRRSSSKISRRHDESRRHRSRQSRDGGAGDRGRDARGAATRANRRRW